MIERVMLKEFLGEAKAETGDTCFVIMVENLEALLKYHELNPGWLSESGLFNARRALVSLNTLSEAMK